MTRGRTRAVLGMGVSLAFIAAMADQLPMDIGLRKQLFLDDRLLEPGWQGRLCVHPPTKRGAVILPELPSEEGRVGLYGSLVQRDDEILMWYWAFEKRVEGKGRRGLALARSRDGVTWEKPVLGLVERQGSKANNLVDTMGDTVSLNPLGPPSERFVLLRPADWDNPATGGIYLSFSPDGVHWQAHAPRLFPFVPDTQNQVHYDDRLGKWVAYLRLWDPDRRVGRLEIPELKDPWPYRQGLAPHLIWGAEHPPVPRGEIPTVLACDAEDPPDTDVYTPVVVRYPWADQAYLMFPSLYQHLPPPAKGGRFPNDGFLDIHLAVSRDGSAWQRPSRQPYLARGAEGEPDSKMLFMFAGLVRVGDCLHHYYCGYDVTHGEYSGNWELSRRGAICLAVQRLDGFVSLCAGEVETRTLTRPLAAAGRRLELNLTVADGGECRVGLLDAAGNALPGYAVADCDAIAGDAIARTVTWQGNADLSRPAAQPLRLVLQMRRADVYAFQFVN